jgi:CHAT domain-containing protein
LSSLIQPLILLGKYDEAFSAAERAKRFFQELGDDRRLARIENNIGNILHRQDRFEEALASYKSAYEKLNQHDDAQGTAAVLSNIALCQTILADFSAALETYKRARAFCHQAKMPRLVAQADYNISYMHYLRGEYSRAFEMLQAARTTFHQTGDAYHSALCDLDQAEMYLELNLSSEAARLSERAWSRFEELGTGYERAKALAFHAIALSHQGKAYRALSLFEKSRKIFVEEKNPVWPWIIDLYRALVLYDEGRLFESRRLAKSALGFFETSILPSKAVLCHLLLARLAHRIGDIGTAHRECRLALDKLETIDVPVLTYQANFLTGQIEESSGRLEKAYEYYQAARQTLEALRSSLHREEMKISFVKNKLVVYESLVHLCLDRDSQSRSAEEAFDYVEQAKSRGLVDLILSSGREGRVIESGESGLAKRIQSLREELNWYYRRIENEQVQEQSQVGKRIQSLRELAVSRENELLRALRELPVENGSFGGLTNAKPLPLGSIQEAIGSECVLLEYYSTRDRIIVCVVTNDRLRIVPLTVSSRVKALVQKLQFQVSKFRLQPNYIETFENVLFEATHTHLQELYTELISPIRGILKGRHLIIVPHSYLHYLPFHALFDGERYLIDDFTVSYAPSASIYAHCHGRSANGGTQSLILGVPSSESPYILEEVHSVADTVPDPLVLLGPDASEEALRSKSKRSRIVHIATHGYYRQDNPMFSAIRLGETHLSLYDLYQLKLPVDLVTLSACATGLSVVVDGDELLGLVRGLLYAGAVSLLVTLWDVHDRTTAEFMRTFYSQLRKDQDKAFALRHAINELRERHPHPYYWAPYALVGKALTSTSF